MPGMSRRNLLSSMIGVAAASSIVSFGVVHSATAADAGSTTTLTEDIDWKSYLSGLDMVWTTMPASLWEAPFLGNGGLGAAAYQVSTPKRLDFELGDSRVRDHQTQSGNGGATWGEARLRIGRLTLDTTGDVTAVDLRLSMWNAELSGSVTTTSGVLWVRAWVHATRDVLGVAVTVVSGTENVAWTFTPDAALSPSADFYTPPAGLLVNPDPVVSGTTCTQDLACGGRTTTTWALRTEADGRTKTLLATVGHSATDHSASTVASTTLAAAQAKTFEQLTTEHRQWWNGFYPASFVTFPDTRVQSFYWLQLYKMASATRRNRPVLGTAGPWLVSTPFPATWWNLNVQLEYWLINATGHFELDSLTQSLDTYRDNLTKNAVSTYQTDSMVIGRTSQEDLVSAVVGPPIASTQVPEEGNLTWALHNAWLTYRHSMDDTALRNVVFPLLRKAINYYLHFLTKDTGGVYHLPKTYSPEYGSTTDCNFDLALIHWGCTTLLAANTRLGLNDTLAATWQDVLDHLVTPPQDADGLRIGADLALTTSHRHYSHLLWFYPLYQLPLSNSANKNLLTTSLAHWLSMPGALRGYSFTGSGSMYALLGDGTKALAQLNSFLTPSTYGVKKNTMYAETGPVIETPLSGAQTIHDMLLQSGDGTIRVFPAVPTAWPDATVHNLRTEGAFQISAVRRAGATSFIRVKSLAGEPCKISPQGLPGPYTVTALSGTATWNTNADGTLQLSLATGADCVIHTTGTTPDLTIAPVAPAAASTPWGIAPTTTCTPVNLSALFTIKATADQPGGGNFDGSGYSYPEDQLPGGGTFVSGNVTWTLPPTGQGTANALTATGQTITLPAGKYKTLHVLGAAVGARSSTVTLKYSDGTTTTAALNLSDWCGSASYGEQPALYTSYRHGPTTDQTLPTHIWHQTIPTDATRTLTSITLPQSSSIRLFALTAQS